VMIVLVSKGILQVNRKLKVSWRSKQAAMMLCTWIKSHIKADKASYSKQKHKQAYQQWTQSQYCRQYYIYGNKKRSAWIATKMAKYNDKPQFFFMQCTTWCTWWAMTQSSRCDIWFWLISDSNQFWCFLKYLKWQITFWIHRTSWH
jgi:hypothetical protein